MYTCVTDHEPITSTDHEPITEYSLAARLSPWVFRVCLSEPGEEGLVARLVFFPDPPTSTSPALASEMWKWKMRRKGLVNNYARKCLDGRNAATCVDEGKSISPDNQHSSSTNNKKNIQQNIEILKIGVVKDQSYWRSERGSLLNSETHGIPAGHLRARLFPRPFLGPGMRLGLDCVHYRLSLSVSIVKQRKWNGRELACEMSTLLHSLAPHHPSGGTRVGVMLPWCEDGKVPHCPLIFFCEAVWLLLHTSLVPRPDPPKKEGPVCKCT